VASPYTTTELLASIRRRARSTNSAAPGFADSDLLAIANEVLLSEVVPEVVSRRASFFRQTIDTTLVVGTSTYAVNTRSVGSVVANFFRVDATDNSVHPLVEWDEEDLQERDPTKQGTPQAFIIQNDQIRLYPVPSKADILRQVLLRRPNRLVAVSAAAAIASISYPGDVTKITITLGADASTFGFTTSTPLDLVSARVPFRSLLDDSTPYSIASNSVGLQPGAVAVAALKADATVVLGGPGSLNGLYAGDYMCLAGQSPVIQLPPEFFPVVAQASACELLRPGRDRTIYRDAVDALKELEEKVYGVVVDRVENQPGYLTGGDWPP
jgi:hypothetical protein